ncbi:MAG: HEAT repeat domain-containing protein [Acidobacteriota bacterium]
MLGLMAMGLPACGSGAGDQPQAVREVVERAVAAQAAGDFDVFVACYTGEKAGRYREEMKTVYGGDAARFFASKRTMVVVGPVSIRRRAFATVRVMVERSTGYKPFDQCGLVFQEGRWRINAFLPGDRTSPRTGSADSDGVIRLLAGEAANARPAGPSGTFRRIEILRALEVLSQRKLEAAAAPLERLLRDDADGGIRQFAALLLGRLGDPSVVPSLAAALDDPDLRVRGEAAAALAALGAVKVLPRLKEQTRQEKVPWTRQQVEQAVNRLAAAGSVQ